MERLFITIFMARSGSKFLMSLLNNHPDVIEYGELFHNREKTFSEPSSIYRKLASLLLCKERVVGFQYRFPRHFKEFPEVQEFLEDHSKSINVIFLQRRNKLKGAISQQNAERLKKETGKAHLFREQADKLGALQLDVDKAVKETVERERLDSEYLSWVSERFRYISVFYEDLVQDPLSEVNRILKFIGISQFKKNYRFESDLVKVTSNDLQEAVSNYEELVERLRKEDLLTWLDEKNDSFENNVEKIKAKRRNVYRSTFRVPGLGSKVILSADAFTLKTRTAFLEHVCKDVSSNKSYVIAADGDKILESNDGGKTWRVFPVHREYKKCFTLLSGRHLLQGDDGTIDLYNEKWEFLKSVQTGTFPWHGSWSIDENPDSGVVMWCEYPYAASEVNVWRSVDQGSTWEKVLVQKGDPLNPKGGDIRHFHLCQHCTTQSGRWYLSSGDREHQSRFWVSHDDGNTWKEILIEDVINFPKELPEKLKGRLFRFTAMIQFGDKLVFPTDDTFQGGGSIVVSMDKNRLGSLTVFDGKCGLNESRNFIRVSDNKGLVFSESKLDRSRVDVSLVDVTKEKVFTLDGLENKEQLKSNFMNTLSSKKSINGEFFSFSDNRIFRPTTRILAWSYAEKNLHHGSKALPYLLNILRKTKLY